MLCRSFVLSVALCTALVGAARLAAQDLDDVQQATMRAAIAKVAPTVVQIETSGGSDIVGSGSVSQQIRKGTGPTTGLIVSPDGYIVSSAFNFANKPSAIFVAIPGHKDRLVAKVVATDHSRMVSLLKVDATGLPVPTATPRKEIRIGQWALALGRTWTSLDTLPSVSAGIVSALGRIYGKAIQTDAKVSPVNYGGPLVDLEGRVMGVLVPASPRGQDETAGYEWYDSGIGFAIPLEDIQAVLPRLKQGHDLHKGQLGVSLQSQDIYGAKPVIVNITPDSAAQRAGIKAGDVLTEIDGVPVVRQAQILHHLGPKYEGDTVSLKVLRGKEEIRFDDVKLTGSQSTFIYAFLGILPVRDDPELGEEVRYVFANSPADAAGIRAGDRIVKIGMGDEPMTSFSGRDELTTILNHLLPGMEIKLEVHRKESQKTETIKLTLGVLSDVLPDKLPRQATRGQALAKRKEAPAAGADRLRPGAPPRARGLRKDEPKKDDKKAEEKPEVKKEEEKKPETGLLKRSTQAGDHEYWAYVPEDYDSNIAHALVIWLHPAGKGKDKDTENMINAWEDYCSENHIILLCPRAESETGWLASEVEFIQQVAQDLMTEYTIDRQRIVAHGMGIGGQMAFYLGFNARDVIRGVATTGAVLTNLVKENVASQRLSFFVVAGGKDPLAEAIAETKTKLIAHKFPVVFREIPEMGNQYFDAVTLDELIRWIDSLDRQ
ncbi:MAG TPA: PDZ domain-containing protein [Gemmataceae bacterium]|nr:PDZ domain-containing protein [Gemmataceae bacterium]